MKKYLIPCILLLVTVLFFYKSFLQFQVPFPGDLLIAEYSPWKFESYLGYTPGSYPNKAQYFDVIRQLYPWKILAIDMWKEGSVPLWNPYNFSGSPLLANNQTGVFYPLNLLFFIFSYSFSWTVYIVLQPFLASLFTYLYLRSLNLKKSSSLFGGIAFGFSLFMSTFLEYGNFGHTILWLPLLFYLIDSFAKKKLVRYLIILAFIVSFIFFAGHLQLAVGVIGSAIAYLIFRLFTQKAKKEIVILVIFIVLGIGLSCIQLIPTVELLVNSARAPHVKDMVNSQFLLQPIQTILFLVPDIYGNPAVRNYLLTDTYPGNAVYTGVLTFILAIRALLIKKKSKELVFFSISFVCLLLLFIRNPLSELIFNIGIFSPSSPSNFFFLLSFCLAVLGSFGFENLPKDLRKTLYSIGIVLAFLLFVVLIHVFLKEAFYLKQLLVFLAFLVLSLGGILLAVKLNRNWVWMGLSLVVALDLFYFFIKFNPFVPASLIYPPTEIVGFLKSKSIESRSMGIGNGLIEPNFQTQFRVLSPDGYDPLYPQSYSKYLSANRSDAKVQFENKKQLDTLSVKYVLDRVENGSDEKILPGDIYKPIYDHHGWKVFENENAYPRAFTNKENGTRAEAKITNYSNNLVIIEVKDRGKLTLTDVNYPGWNAYLNGEKIRIEKDSIFRTVSVGSSGDLSFVYEPKSFSMGLLVTIISILITLTSAFFLGRKSYGKV